MTTPRSQQISIADTPYYHCYARCVRRAFLCGKDEFSGKDYTHRKQWIAERLAKLSTIFAIDICAYAIMSNHYHLVLHINTEKAKNWDDKTIITRWNQLFQANKTKKDTSPNKETSPTTQANIKAWRSRLQDISWFMRCLNESIARRANIEDNCTGRFWEGRFKSQALLDEAALLTCMAYVDLNPIRAKQAKTLEDSAFTSIQQRIKEHNQTTKAKIIKLAKLNEQSQPTTPIPYTHQDYLELIHCTSKAITTNKKNHPTKSLSKITQKLSLEPTQYLNQVQHFEKKFPRVAGKLETLKSFCKEKSLTWVKGMGTNQTTQNIAIYQH